MENFAGILRTIGVGRLITLMVALAIITGILVTFITRINSPGMALLYGGLSPQEVVSMTGRLGSLNVPYDVRGEDALYVPTNRVSELRLQMAGEGLVSGNSNGYEIFDKGSSFGTTSLVQNINARRALEGELARTIAFLPLVQSARVHIVMPKTRAFSKDKTAPSAAVALNVGSRMVEKSQINSIAHLVAAAVPNLTASGVTIVDQRGVLLFSQEDGASSGLSAQAAMRQKVERDYETRITSMLENLVGVGKVSVKAVAVIDFDRVEEQQEKYNPNEQVARSEQRSEVTTTSSQQNGNPAVGVTGNAPGGAEGSSVGASSNETRTEETINYEISKTIRRFMKESGAVEKMSIAVLVEGGQREGDAYTPMGDEKRTQIEGLVKAAMGFDESRGDTLEITDLPFTQPEEVGEIIEEPLLTKADVMMLVQYGLLALGLIIVSFVVVRPILKTVAAIMPTPVVIQQSVGGGGGASPGAAPAATADAGADEGDMDISQVAGRVKKSSVRKVNEIVDNYPEESVNTVRAWMSGQEKSEL